MTLESMSHFYKIETLSEAEKKQLYATPLEYWDPKEKGDDCVVRALSKVLPKSYEEIEEELKKYAEDLVGDVYTSVYAYGPYLKELYGAKAIKLINKEINGYIFCKVFVRGTYVVRTKGHVYSVIDGCAYDSWNSLGDKIDQVWELPGEQTTLQLNDEQENANDMVENYRYWNRQ